jgi:hypothetical protein
MSIKGIIKRISDYLGPVDKIISDTVIEFDLLDFNEDLEKAWATINALYDKILHKDKYWHLFYEGDFSTLRCSRRYKGQVMEFFKKYDIKYKFNGMWVDGSPTVEKYKNIYKAMFHTFSELAIQLDEKDILNVADRVCHSFFDHMFYMAKEHRKPFEEEDDSMSALMWEAEMMARLSVFRAHYVGRYDQSKQLKNLNEKGEKAV